jgi:hypothetical protein
MMPYNGSKNSGGITGGSGLKLAVSAGLRFSISGAILFAVYFFQIKRTEHRSDHHHHGNNPQQLQYQEQELQKKDPPEYKHERNTNPSSLLAYSPPALTT